MWTLNNDSGDRLPPFSITTKEKAIYRKRMSLICTIKGTKQKINKKQPTLYHVSSEIKKEWISVVATLYKNGCNTDIITKIYLRFSYIIELKIHVAKMDTAKWTWLFDFTVACTQYYAKCDRLLSRIIPVTKDLSPARGIQARFHFDFSSSNLADADKQALLRRIPAALDHFHHILLIKLR